MQIIVALLCPITVPYFVTKAKKIAGTKRSLTGAFEFMAKPRIVEMEFSILNASKEYKKTGKALKFWS